MPAHPAPSQRVSYPPYPTLQQGSPRVVQSDPGGARVGLGRVGGLMAGGGSGGGGTGMLVQVAKLQEQLKLLSAENEDLWGQVKDTEHAVGGG